MSTTNPLKDDADTIGSWLFKFFFKHYAAKVFPGISIYPEDFKRVDDIAYISYTKVDISAPYVPPAEQPKKKKAISKKKVTAEPKQRKTVKKTTKPVAKKKPTRRRKYDDVY